MSVILTMTATLTGDGVMTSTTSGIALTDVLKGALIVSLALLASLIATELLSLHKGRAFPFYNSKNGAIAVLGLNMTLMIIFCISVAFNVALLL
jgi:hypothetical protein